MTQQKQEEGIPFCPYCDGEMIEEAVSYCKACGVTVFYCPECRKPLSRENKVCPHCGTEIRG